ncbi:restriction endonuclease subunit S [Malaciobacter mytili]|uniref:restriction endonuclease subunit S n=1 Tax=Malaciobacter mytili TaxID=603050 RepID=UPI003A87BDE1
MNKIDISTWKDFPICGQKGIFKLVQPIARKSKEYIEEGDVPFVASGAFNNGIEKCVKTNEVLDKGNCITVSAIGGFSFYQERDFVGRGGAGSAIKILYNKNLNKLNALFICAILQKTLSKYDYNSMISGQILKEESIYLPITNKDEINWHFMETYIKNLKPMVNNYLNQLQSIKLNSYKKLDLKNWKRFNLYDKELFSIDSGNKLDKSKMTTINPKINFIGRANQNNGITMEVDEIKDIKPYKKGYLTLALGGEYLGSCFIQPKDFYTSQNVNVLIPNKEISHSAKQFISIMIFRESRTYYKAFVDELNRHVKTDFSILLPVNNDGQINWSFMETYIERIKESTLKRLDVLSDIVLYYLVFIFSYYIYNK